MYIFSLAGQKMNALEVKILYSSKSITIVVFVVKPFNPDIAKSKIHFPTASHEWSHFRVLYMESKVRELCITQGFTLGVKELRLLLRLFITICSKIEVKEIYVTSKTVVSSRPVFDVQIEMELRSVGFCGGRKTGEAGEKM